MKAEKDVKPENRYLFSDEILSAKAIDIIKQEIVRRYQSGAYDIFNSYKNQLDEFLAWEPHGNEIALFTLYAYADMEIPLEYDCLFNIQNPEEYINTPVTITQSVYEGFYPVNTIADGHKHTLICNFKNGIPDIIGKLHVGESKFSSVPKNPFTIGICHMKDFPQIAENRKKVLFLKEKYKQDWWKYYDD